MVSPAVVGWLLIKLFVLYAASLAISFSIFIYLNRAILPPHQTLKYSLVWQRSSDNNLLGIVELVRGQRLGGNFNLEDENLSETLIKDSVMQGRLPYDLSLLLKYPDRPEIADLGNLRIVMNLMRRDGQVAGKIEIVKALRYETRILRLFRELLSIPGAIWKDCGSERTERISLAKRLVDDPNNSGKFGVVKRREKDFGVDQFISKKSAKSNPIDRIEISISPLPPLHSIHLEILANLSPLQHFLFHWRIPSAILIIGACTTFLWFLITIYGLVEVIRILIDFRQEFASVKDSKITEIIEFSAHEEEEDKSSDTLSLESVNSDEDSAEIGSSVHFPPAETVANFIGDLRQRKLNAITGQEDDDEVSRYDSEVEDQSVPERQDIEEGKKEE